MPSSAAQRQCAPVAVARDIVAPEPVVQPWWIAMPKDGEPVFRFVALQLPAAPSVETIVFSYRVPVGKALVIKRAAQLLSTPALIQGSGDIVWRIRVSGRYLEGYGDMRTEMGSFAEMAEVPGGIILNPTALLQYTVENVAFMAGTSYTICGFKGWLCTYQK